MKNKKIIFTLLVMLSVAGTVGAKVYVDRENEAAKEKKEQEQTSKEQNDVCQKEDLDCLFVGCNSYN